MNTTLEQQLTSFWTMEEKDLARIHGMIGKIVDLRAECRSVTMPVNQMLDLTAECPKDVDLKAPNLPANISKSMASQRVTLGARNPMRAPKPSSLRGAVHDLLRTAGKPLRRAQIISEVASRRGERISENFKAKVGDLLTNRHDPRIRRIGHGIYTYAHE